MSTLNLLSANLHFCNQWKLDLDLTVRMGTVPPEIRNDENLTYGTSEKVMIDWAVLALVITCIT